MPIVSFGVSTLYLDAYGAITKTSPTTPLGVLTDAPAPVMTDDNVWSVTIVWNTTTNAAHAVIYDADTNMAAGPTVLQFLPATSGTGLAAFVAGTNTTVTSYWDITAAGIVTGFQSGLPVLLSQYNQNTRYYLQAPAPPTNNVQAIGSPLVGGATRWTFTPMAAPNTTFLGYKPISGNATITVEMILTQLWNASVGTEWASRWAPLLIAWAYDYPTGMNLNNPTQWATDLAALVTAYTGYFINNPATPGWGYGQPPATSPPPGPVIIKTPIKLPN